GKLASKGLKVDSGTTAREDARPTKPPRAQRKRRPNARGNAGPANPSISRWGERPREPSYLRVELLPPPFAANQQCLRNKIRTVRVNRFRRRPQRADALGGLGAREQQHIARRHSRHKVALHDIGHPGP